MIKVAQTTMRERKATPSEIMRRIKGRSSNKIFECFPELKRRYWGLIFGQEVISV